MSPRMTFENELAVLQSNVVDMASCVEVNYEQLFVALENKDEEEIKKFLTSDKAIVKQQREIESQCLFLITKQQPIVGDLRIVTTALKVVTDIWRVGNSLVDMAELLLRLQLTDLKNFSVHINGMIAATKEMLHEAVKAFEERDIQKAKEVILLDDVIDELFNKVKQDLLEDLKREAKDADECIDVLMIAKYLEKIGDHAANICRWEIFRETGNMDDMRIL